MGCFDMSETERRTREEAGKARLTIAGMTCATCARNVERALSGVEGVRFAAVNLATETAFLVLDEPVPMEIIEKAVENAGYEVSRENPEDMERNRYVSSRSTLLYSLALTVPLSVLMIMHMSGANMPWFLPFEAAATGLVVLGCGWKTIRGAWIAARHLHTNMDTLITLGSTLSWLTSLLALSGVSIASFGAVGAMIMTLHISGRFIESRLRDRASREVKSLLRLQAREARVMVGEEEVMLPIEAVKEGFLVVVRPGERLPVDGVVQRGDSSVDESMITGESIPVRRGEGDDVTGGSLNLTGGLLVRATGIGEDSFLSRMASLVEEAQGAKIPIQALADRITLYFVPTVLGLALVSGLFWFFRFDVIAPLQERIAGFLPWAPTPEGVLSFSVFVTVATLVIACPCALGLATPMALVSGTGLASRMGLIIRNAEAIQTSRDIGVVIMDKTGTLTEGNPSVVEHTLSDEDMSAAAAVERESNHPLARAVSGAVDSDAKAFNITETAGEGIAGKVNGSIYEIGKPVESSSYAHLVNRGLTVIEVTRDGLNAGYIAVEDPVRQDAALAVKRLGGLGVKVIMATGDQGPTARAVASRVGLEDVRASLSPGDKLAVVRQAQALGRKVMMVGDGMNDAAALKGADIGVAIGSGMDLAIDSADVVIVRGGVESVLRAILVSRKTFSVIRQNLFWAFVYNIVAIPMAMLGLLHPAVAEAAMAFSSISVVLNSLRIKKGEDEI